MYLISEQEDSGLLFPCALKCFGFIFRKGDIILIQVLAIKNENTWSFRIEENKLRSTLQKQFLILSIPSWNDGTGSLLNFNENFKAFWNFQVEIYHFKTPAEKQFPKE